MNDDPYDPPERLRELPSWQLARVANHAARLVADALAQEGGRRRQHYSVLAALAEQGPASQADLGRRLWIDRSDLHGLLAELEDDGLVARVRDEHDRRRNVVTLTRTGGLALKRLDKRVQSAQAELLAPLSEADRIELQRLLAQLLPRADGSTN
jgi:DNA-binding MarR family transcriptional regulator